MKSLPPSLVGVAALSLSFLAQVPPATASEPIPSCGATDRHFDPNEVPVAPVGTGAVYYVDGATGKDTNNGTSEQTAFKTIGKAVNGSSAVIGPGVTVRIKAGLYREQVNITKSGSATARAVVGAYGDGPVIMDGSTAVTGWTLVSGQIYKATPNFTGGGSPVGVTAVVVDEQALFPENSLGALVEGRWYYDGTNLYVWCPGGGSPATHDVGVIKDYEYENTIYLNPSSYLTLYGLTVRFSSGNGVNVWGDYVRIEKCRIIFAGKTGISMFPYSTINTTNTEIIKNEIYANFLRNWPRGRYKWGGWGMGAVSNGTANVLYQGNVSHRNNGEGLGAYSGSGGTTFRDNVVYDNWSVNIYIDNQTNGLIENNFIYCHAPDKQDLYNNGDTTPSDNSNLKRLRPEGIMTADEDYGNGSHLSNVTIQNNVVVNCRRGYNHYADVSTSALKNVSILNNTFLVGRDPVSGETTFSGMLVPYNGGQNAGSLIKDNVVYGTNSSMYLLERDDGSSSSVDAGTTFSNNSWYHTTNTKPFLWGGSTFNHTNWGALSGAAHTTGDIADAQLVDPVTIEDVDSKAPGSGSPALDAGANTGTPYDYDFCPRPQGSAYDIGAFEGVGAPANPAFSIADVSVTEGDTGTTNAVFTVSLIPTASGTATVHYATADGTAKAGADYTATSGDLTFTAGQASKTLTVPVINNTTVDGNRTFTVNLSAATGATIVDASATGTIVDNDVAPSLQFSAATYSVGEGGGSATITVTRTGGTTSAVTVAYATSNGTATAGSDYTAASGTLSFASGVTSQTFSVAITQDTLVEANETVNLTVSSPTAGAILGSQKTAVLTIIDDDTAQALQFNAATFSVGEGGGSATITVTRTGGSTGSVTVNYATSNGTATAGSDYTAASGTLTFGAGVTSQTLSVPILQDTLVEGSETVNLALSAPSSPGVLGVQSTAILTIVDDDIPPSQPVVWTAAVGVSVNGNSLTKTAAGNAWNAGASSSQSLAAGDGYIEITASEGNTYRMLGLSNGDSGVDYTDIDFAIFPAVNTALMVYEKGVSRGTFGTYVTGDRLQVSVESGVVKYKKNGTTFYTSRSTPVFPLLVDASLYTAGSTLNSAVVSGGWSTVSPPPPPPSTTPVVWTSTVGVTVNGNSLTKTAATGWNAGASSSQSLASGDGYIEITASETNTYRMLGLSNGDSGVDYTDIDFAIYPGLSGALMVYEKGVSRGTFGTYMTGDKLQVSVESGVVKYKKNGTTFYTSASTPVFPLLVDASLYTAGATLNSAVLSGTWSTSAPPPPPSTAPVVWASTVGVSVNGNSLTKTAAGNAWNAGASSSQSLASGDGYIEITASETNTYRMLGLSNGDSTVDYADIDFAIFPAVNGALMVYEKGVSRGTFGTYMTGDKLQVSVESGVVKYKKNGATFYTSTSTPVFPLLVDASLYNAGATLNSAMVSGSWSTAAPPPSTASVVWTSTVGVTVNGNSLTKTAATGWNAGASSSQSLASGDGYIEITASETNTYRMLGLSKGDSSVNYTDIDFAIFPAVNSALMVYEKGVSRGTFGTYAPGDKLQVSVESGVVKYKKNGAVFYTSAKAPAYPLLVDSSLYTQGATLSSAVVSGSWQ